MSSPEYDILVTGSSGHLGAALMLSLPSHGHTPLGIDILPSSTTTHTLSITDRAALTTLFTSHPSIKHIIHAATLHKPHVASHPKQAFIDTNITGTLALLETSSAHLPSLRSFIFISTTSTYGSALAPASGSPAAWITESTPPVPKNIYGATKTAAEDLVRLHHLHTSLPCLVLRTARFFPEADDDPARRAEFPGADANLKVCELAHRRLDIADAVSAVICAVRRAPEIGFGRYIVSAPPPFPDDGDTLARLNAGAGAGAEGVYRACVPAAGAVFEKLGWRFPDRVDRVYDSARAVRELGWRPEWTFGKVVERLARGEDWRSELTHVVGKRGYHDVPTGVYTT